MRVDNIIVFDNIMCTLVITSSDAERSFEALNRDGRIAMASSITVLAVTSILFFTVGFLCGHFCHKEMKQLRLFLLHKKYKLLTIIMT